MIRLSDARPLTKVAIVAGVLAAIFLAYALCAVLVALFGLAYAWLAAQRRMDQALLGLAASGKAAVFVLFAVLWTRGAVSEVVLLAAVGDLGFAALWAWWLLRGARRSRGDAA